MTLTSSVSSYVAGYGLDRQQWSPRSMAFWLGVAFCVPGLLWLLMLSRWRATDAPLEEPGPVQTGEEEVLEGRVG